MTALTPARRSFLPSLRGEWNDDARQLVAVLLVALIALVIGYGVETMATTSTRNVTAGSVTASIPTNWIYQPGAQDLLFTAVDPRNPGQRYSVTRPAVGGSDASAIATTTIAAKSQLLTDFQVLGRSTTSINGKDAPSVTYTYVSTRNGQMPQVIEGRDLFIQGATGVLIVSLESPAKSFDNALDTFVRFAASVRG